MSGMRFMPLVRLKMKVEINIEGSLPGLALHAAREWSEEGLLPTWFQLQIGPVDVKTWRFIAAETGPLGTVHTNKVNKC